VVTDEQHSTAPLLTSMHIPPPKKSTTQTAEFNKYTYK